MLRSRQSLLGTPINASSRDSLTGSDGVAKDEREQRLIYLRQAFVGFVKAKHNSEMQNLGRVICAILALSPAEEASIMESISTIAPAVVASTTFGTLTSSFTNIFN